MTHIMSSGGLMMLDTNGVNTKQCNHRNEVQLPHGI